jgi:hypothetical protein
MSNKKVFRKDSTLRFLFWEKMLACSWKKEQYLVLKIEGMANMLLSSKLFILGRPSPLPVNQGVAWCAVNRT